MNKLLKLDLEYIKRENMILNDYGHSIYLIENFITPEVQKEMMDYINKWTEEDWRVNFLNHLKKVALFEYGSEDIIHLIGTKKIKDVNIFFRNYERQYDKSADLKNFKYEQWMYERWEKLFIPAEGIDKSRFDIDRATNIDRRYKGTSTPVHIDQDENNVLIYATILYINEDYEGGEIFFEECGVTIKPKAGSLCLFDGEKKWKHGVKEVTKGIRYYSPVFIWDNTKNSTYRIISK